MSFKALLLSKENDQFTAKVTTIEESELNLQAGEVIMKNSYSTLNYKDALAITNKGAIVQKWPMVAGIDVIGEVVSDASGKYKKGDRLILNGFGASERFWGGLAEFGKYKADYLVPLPAKLTPWEAMALGTAGYTAALCVQSLLDHGITKEKGAILVSGATGGVGSVSCYLLSKMGFEVVALSSKVAEKSFFNEIGVTKVLEAKMYYAQEKALQKEEWQAAIDVLGSHTLVNILAQIKYGGVVAACGLAQGMDLPGTVIPFILRNITLSGIDSVNAPLEKRFKAWNLLNEWIDREFLDKIVQTISFDEVIPSCAEIMAGKIKGRFVVDL